MEYNVDQAKLDALGIYLMAALAVSLVIPVATFFLNLGNFFYASLVYLAFAGAAGGTVHGLRSLYKHLHAQDFGFNWSSWYLARPLKGVFMGIAAYLTVLVLLGIGVLSQTQFFGGILLFCSIAFLLGYVKT
jgi:hypothetical protein